MPDNSNASDGARGHSTGITVAKKARVTPCVVIVVVIIDTTIVGTFRIADRLLCLIVPV
jgi:hypothetical protein